MIVNSIRVNWKIIYIISYLQPEVVRQGRWHHCTHNDLGNAKLLPEIFTITISIFNIYCLIFNVEYFIENKVI